MRGKGRSLGRIPIEKPDLVAGGQGSLRDDRQIILRRAKPLLVADVLKVGDIELNRTAMSVLRCGNAIHLSPTDYRLLEFLMQAPGRVFSRDQLLNSIWGTDVYIDGRTVDVHIGRLRKALLQAWSSDPIRTVRGAGYSFEAV